jgi:hypothetical protein
MLGSEASRQHQAGARVSEHLKPGLPLTRAPTSSADTFESAPMQARLLQNASYNGRSEFLPSFLDNF